jgi:DNA processing protein
MAADLTTDDKIDWLRLCRTAGIGPKSFFRLLHRCGSAAAALQALPRLAREAGREPPRCCSEAEARAELEALTALGCRLVAHGEPGYPKQLGRIHDPPPLLTLRGDPAVLELPAVALVGARNASANGRLLARRFAGELAAGGTQGAGLAVVSGLARGIDTAAHEGALAAGGCTIAVIAAGVDIAYPEENAALMAAIAAQGVGTGARGDGGAGQPARCAPSRHQSVAPGRCRPSRECRGHPPGAWSPWLGAAARPQELDARPGEWQRAGRASGAAAGIGPEGAGGALDRGGKSRSGLFRPCRAGLRASRHRATLG